MLKIYLATALRMLWKNKTYTLLNIFGLAAGIACAGLSFLWIEDELRYDHWHTKKKYLYQVLENQSYDGNTYTSPSTPGPLAQGLKADIPGINNTCRLTWGDPVLLAAGDKSFYERGYYADPSFFDMFSFTFEQGQADGALNAIHSVVITEGTARKIFGTAKNVTGKLLKVNNKEEYVITGVLKDIPGNSTLAFDWIMPFDAYLQNNNWLTRWQSNGVQTFAELAPSTSAGVINGGISKYLQSKDPSNNATLFLFGMNDWRLRNNFENGKQAGGRIGYVRMFSIIAWIILAVACINFMNLATARSEKRAKEVGVRKALGARKKSLVSQFLWEAMLLSFVSVIIAVIIILLVMPAFNQLVEKELSLALSSPVHISALLLLAIACGLAAGSYPSLYLSSFRPVQVLKSFTLSADSAGLIRKGLVVAQFTMSIVLIISTLVIYRQVQHVRNRPLGYNKDNLLQMDLKGDLKKNFATARQQLINTGLVENAALSGLQTIYMGNTSSNFSWPGKNADQQVPITQNLVSPEYIGTSGMEIVKGRDFRQPATQDSGNVIINEAFARLMGNQDPVGETITENKNPYKVIGVVKDFVFGDMYAKSAPVIFFCYPKSSWTNFMYVRLKPGVNKAQALAQVEKIIKSANPGYPFEYKFVNNEFNQQFSTETMTGNLTRLFAAIAIIISCLGLFGLATYTAERRTKEIGIRKVLGASVAGITGLLTKEFLQLVLLSTVLAFPIAWWVMRNWLQHYAYRITMQWWIFAMAGLMALFIALVTVSVKAIKAALANPAGSLRSD